MTDPTPVLRSSPRAWTVYLAVLLLAGGLYVATVAPGPLWQDSGMAQVRVLQRDLYGHLGLALSHPLYYLCGFSFQYLPLGNPAFRTNLVSALWGAVTVANLCLLVWLATGAWRGGIVAAISLAVAHTFWQHCCLAEVYTLTTALLTTELICLVQFERTRRFGWLVLLLLANGLGISNHMVASLSLGVYGVLLLYLLWSKALPVKVAAFCAVAWLAGASVYIYMTAVTCAHVGFVEGVRSALFGAYQRSVLNLTFNARQLLNSALYLAMNFPTPLVLVLPLGLLTLRHGTQRLFGVALASLTLVHLMWAVRYDVPDQYTFFIPSIVLLAALIGLGAERFLSRRSGAKWVLVLAGAAALPAAVYIPLPAIAQAMDLNLGLTRSVPYRNEYEYFLHPWKTGYHGAEQFAEELQRGLSDGAVLIADSTTVQPIYYLQLTGRWGKQVLVYPPLDKSGAQPPLTEAGLAQQLAAGQVYVLTPSQRYGCPRWLLEQYELTREGLVYKVSGRKTPFLVSGSSSPAAS